MFIQNENPKISIYQSKIMVYRAKIETLILRHKMWQNGYSPKAVPLLACCCLRLHCMASLCLHYALERNDQLTAAPPFCYCFKWRDIYSSRKKDYIICIYSYADWKPIWIIKWLFKRVQIRTQREFHAPTHWGYLFLSLLNVLNIHS